VIYDGIKGETVKYNGVDYQYKGIGKVDITTTGTPITQTKYTLEMKKGVKFSDGKSMTIDDYIFSMYVYLDPFYDGSVTLNSVDIVGLKEYQTGLPSEILGKYLEIAEKILDDGGEFVSGHGYTRDQYDIFFSEDAIEKAYYQLALEIHSYCLAKANMEAMPFPYDDKYYAQEGFAIAYSMYYWGFGEFDEEEFGFTTYVTETFFSLTGSDFPTLEDYAVELMGAYGDDGPGIIEADDIENAGDNKALSFLQMEFARVAGAEEAGSAAIKNVSGIKRVNDYKAEITVDKFNASAIYQLGIAVSPRHYYGDAAKYNYAQDKFGFDKGDLSGVKAKTTQPMGAGPYKFVEYKNGVVYFEANKNYWEGEPAIKYLQFMETNDNDKLEGVKTARFDISDPSFNKDVAAEIKSINSNGTLSGNKLHTELPDFNGYGYIGISANTIKVGTDGASAQSKNLRKAIATILAVCREVAVDSYYGDQATVINYPISNVSWAAPQPADQGYEIAFSKGVNGAAIYANGDTQAQKETKAKAAALAYLQAAGYTVTDGKVASAPAGAKMTYTAAIVAGGGDSADHPSFSLLNRAKALLGEIGLEIIIDNRTSITPLVNANNAGTSEIWCMAWGGGIDPDMYQIYHSSNRPKPVGGAENSTQSNSYCINDSNLDKLIMDGRSSPDRTFRKNTYKAALDIILDWAVEVPIYQRKEAFIFNAENVRVDSITPAITPFWGWLAGCDTLKTYVKA